jgi:hypothetical protein
VGLELDDRHQRSPGRVLPVVRPRRLPSLRARPVSRQRSFRAGRGGRHRAQGQRPHRDSLGATTRCRRFQIRPGPADRDRGPSHRACSAFSCVSLVLCADLVTPSDLPNALQPPRLGRCRRRSFGRHQWQRDAGAGVASFAPRGQREASQARWPLRQRLPPPRGWEQRSAAERYPLLGRKLRDPRSGRAPAEIGRGASNPSNPQRSPSRSSIDSPPSCVPFHSSANARLRHLFGPSLCLPAAVCAFNRCLRGSCPLTRCYTLQWTDRPFERYSGPWTVKDGLRKTRNKILWVGNTLDPCVRSPAVETAASLTRRAMPQGDAPGVCEANG